MSSLRERVSRLARGPRHPASSSVAQYQSLSQSQLIVRGFRKHRLAVVSTGIIGTFYLVAVLCDFLAPYPAHLKLDLPFAQPMRVRMFDADGLQRPFVYRLVKSRDPVTLRAIYDEDRSARYPVKLLIRSHEYRLLGLFQTRVHLFGVEEPGVVALFGTDHLGRDIFSRTLIATRISCSIGLVSIFISLLLGLMIGAISGLFGGVADLLIQKVIEVLASIPGIPLWLALAAAFPKDWSALMVYFAITVVLSLQGWIGVARVVRGKFLSLKEEDYIMAARNFGAGSWHVIVRHMIPNFMSYVIVSVTLSIPSMIIGETALSFLGIGLRPPIVSWGVLLQAAQNLHSIVDYPWTLIPALFVIAIVLAFNFAGDGLRDAADPYSRT